MKIKSQALLIVISLVAVASFAFGQGGPPSAERRIAANVQYAFDAPSGWKRTENADGYTITSSDGALIILVRPHGENDFANAFRTTEIDNSYTIAREPSAMDNGGRSFRVAKQLANGGTGVVDVFIMLSPNGGGVLVMALSSPANSEAAYKIGLRLANSVSFPGTRSTSRPVAPQSDTKTGSPWESRLGNKHLLYLYSGNGYFEERHYYLCSSGIFYFKAGSGGFTPGNSDGGSFAGRSGNSGRWGVSGSTLVLQYNNGNLVRLALTERQKSSEIGLNGTRYFIEPQTNCQ